MSRPTDHAVRNLAELHLQSVRGQSGGQILWQPRIGAWISDKQFEGEPFPEPYTGLSKPDIFRALGVSTRLYEYNTCFRQVEDERVTGLREQVGPRDTRHLIETPVGRQEAITRTTPTNRGTIWVKRWVTSAEELRVAIWRAEHTTWQWDQATFDRLQAEWGSIGAPTMYLPRVNLQDLYINTMGVEPAVYAMQDWPDLVDAYFRALDELHERLIEVINASPIEIINFGDNLHAATLPPYLYEKYVLPAYLRRTAQLHRGGKFVHSHWDGDCGPLLKFARCSGLDGIEAITPKPQGDVTLEQIKDALGNEVWLLDGIPAVYFDPTFPIETLQSATHRVLELFAPRLILGISDEISSHGDIERIRVVTEIVDDYNAALAARE